MRIEYNGVVLETSHLSPNDITYAVNDIMTERARDARDALYIAAERLRNVDVGFGNIEAAATEVQAAFDRLREVERENAELLAGVEAFEVAVEKAPAQYVIVDSETVTERSA